MYAVKGLYIQIINTQCGLKEWINIFYLIPFPSLMNAEHNLTVKKKDGHSLKRAGNDRNKCEN